MAVRVFRWLLNRSAWKPLADRGRFYLSGRVDSKAVNWATKEIVAFIKQEEKRGTFLGDQVQNDLRFQPLLKKEKNLLRRIRCLDPPSIH